MKKVSFLLGLAVGFLVGSRAGSGPYQQLEATVRSAARRPEVVDVSEKTKKRHTTRSLRRSRMSRTKCHRSRPLPYSQSSKGHPYDVQEWSIAQHMNVVERTLRRVDAAQQHHVGSAFVLGIMKKYGDDYGGCSLAVQLTYAMFMTVFPLLLLAVTILSIVLADDPSFASTLSTRRLGSFRSSGSNSRTTSMRSSAVRPSVWWWASLGSSTERRASPKQGCSP